MYNFHYCLAYILLLQGIACDSVEDHNHDQQWIYNDVEPLQNTSKPDKVKRSAGKLFSII